MEEAALPESSLLEPGTLELVGVEQDQPVLAETLQLELAAQEHQKMEVTEPMVLETVRQGLQVLFMAEAVLEEKQITILIELEDLAEREL
jgi:hypothetical protein